jgi:hypothetical protein
MKHKIVIRGKDYLFRVPEPDVSEDDFDLMDELMKLAQTVDVETVATDKNPIIPYVVKFLDTPRLSEDDLFPVGIVEAILIREFSTWMGTQINNYVEGAAGE